MTRTVLALSRAHALVLLTLSLASANAVAAQGTREDYERAEAKRSPPATDLRYQNRLDSPIQ